MKKRSAIMLAIVFAAALASYFLWAPRTSSRSSAYELSKVEQPSTSAAEIAVRSPPSSLAKSTIRGAVKDSMRTPIASATVCADSWSELISEQLTQDPICTVSDDKGRFELAGLLSAKYSLDAAAPTFVPATFHPFADDPQRAGQTSFQLAPGEVRSDVEIILPAGGVKVSGNVSDISGGPIVNARVRVTAHDASGPIVTTDTKGNYTAWTKPGQIELTAVADGYNETRQSGRAPGISDLKLTPASAIAGIVIDHTGTPVVGARVSLSVVDGSWQTASSTDLSDEAGHFKIARLGPGRYKVSARGPRAYGTAVESTLLGLGQTVDGVVVKLSTASDISGRVIARAANGVVAPCAGGEMWIEDPQTNFFAASEIHEQDGSVRFEGMMPGSYNVNIRCLKYKSAKNISNIVVVAGKDQAGLEWQVSSRSTVRGIVSNGAGAPVAAVVVGLRRKDANDMNSYFDRSLSGTSDESGLYEIFGVDNGEYVMTVDSASHAPPKVSIEVAVAEQSTVTKNLVLASGGKIRVTVTDADARPVKNIEVTTTLLSQAPSISVIRYGIAKDTTAADGVFIKEGLEPGEYRVNAVRGWQQNLRKPGTTAEDGQGERVVVKNGETSDVKVVIEDLNGVITGVVTTSNQQAITDAYIVATRESDSAGSGDQDIQINRFSFNESVLTDGDGAFKLSNLAAGKYTVRAYRKGGGEAISHHVSVGSSLKMTIAKTGSMSGVVVGNSVATGNFEIAVHDKATNFSRNEDFYNTSGAFAMRDLPPGEFDVIVTAAGLTGSARVKLLAGDNKTDVELVLGATVIVTGTLVDEETKQPVSGVAMFAFAEQGGIDRLDNTDNDRVSNAQGVFAIKDIAPGKVRVQALSFKDDSPWGYAAIRREIPADAKARFDVGKIAVVRRRIKPGQTPGSNGLTLKQPLNRFDDPPLEITQIDPRGPAAKLDCKVGDVIIAIDGIDVTGERRYLALTLISGPAGSKITLALQRGVTVVLTLQR
jgi:hypothetical protein